MNKKYFIYTKQTDRLGTKFSIIKKVSILDQIIPLNLSEFALSVNTNPIK